jgi:hypothetical protein
MIGGVLHHVPVPFAVALFLIGLSVATLAVTSSNCRWLDTTTVISGFSPLYAERLEGQRRERARPALAGVLVFAALPLLGAGVVLPTNMIPPPLAAERSFTLLAALTPIALLAGGGLAVGAWLMLFGGRHAYALSFFSLLAGAAAWSAQRNVFAYGIGVVLFLISLWVLRRISQVADPAPLSEMRRQDYKGASRPDGSLP